MEKRERVLVLTANKYQAEKIGDYFKGVSCEVYLAKDRKNSIEILERQEAEEESIDFLVLEEIVGNATTKPLFKYLRKAHPNLGVILLYESDSPYMAKLRAPDEERAVHDPVVCLKKEQYSFDRIALEDAFVISLRIRDEKRARQENIQSIIDGESSA